MNKIIQKINSTNKNFSLYIERDSLLVYSFISNALYGFRAIDAVIFLLMEEINSISLVEKELIKQEIKVDKKLLSIMNDICQGRDKEINSDDNIEEFGLDSEIDLYDTKLVLYNLNGWYFSIRDELCVIKELKSLEYSKSKEHISASVSQISIKSNYEVVVNDIYRDKVPSKEHLIPFLYGLIRSIYCQKVDFLVTLHAASLKYNNKILIMPGGSGMGKSTLSIFLIHNKFELFSDELTIITKDKKIIPIPLGIGVKEGSWEIVATFVSNISKWKIHRRYDNQKVKYIIPDKFLKKEFSAINAVIIFPTYIKGSKTILREIDMVDALSYIIKTQYYFSDIKDINLIESWLNLLSSCSIYKLSYSSLEEAKNIIKKVMENEQI